ncbi:hypothetical protein [Vibrio vulnificus]|uniref:hypothetical protein n=1 Tax=Vibrio vulnificus TaxID=672 RepID=UPI004059419F
MEPEVKPSFSMKYVILTLITTVLVSVVGIVINKAFESKVSKELIITSKSELNIIEAVKSPGLQISSRYTLKDENQTEIRSLLSKTFVVENVSNEGVDDLEVSIAIDTEKAKLIEQPEITTDPKYIIDGVRVVKEESSNETNHHWRVSLLNPGESIQFSYSAYSELEDVDVSWNFVPRKKDWSVKTRVRERDPITQAFGSASFALFTMMFFLTMTLVVSIPAYYLQWSRREDFRLQYGSFMRFWREHRPWKLFS